MTSRVGRLRAPLGLALLCAAFCHGCGPSGFEGEELCDNLVDDDGDGLADCGDPDCASDPVCAGSSDEVCNNGVDDDGDLQVDCRDSDCAGDPVCTSSGEEICDNRVDDDGDGDPDCLDSSCVSDPACTRPVGAEDCRNGADDDGDRRTDCEDPDCERDPACATAEDCSNGADDDGDGAADCADPDCAGYRGCEARAEECDNGADDDGDRRIDCDDPDCESDAVCADLPPEDCGNRRDDDGDSRIDCDDPDCAAECHDDTPAEVCDNGRDDDGDGRTDCCDAADCLSDPHCLSEEDCTDRLDDDCDGHHDCDDRDCSDDAACSGTTDPGCATYHTCASCLAASGCGWCDSSDQCKAGSYLGPDDDSCAWLDWDWMGCSGSTDPDPTDPCRSHTDCASCTADYANACGFCATTSTCQQGTSAGPSSGTCTSWDWYVSDCSGDPTPTCSSHTSCSSCIAATGCGWCDSSDTCMPGSYTGPTTGSCAWADWDWVDCAAPADPCASHGDCSSCTADYTNACGFCATSSTCQQGTASGPSSGSCSSWDWTVSDCGGASACSSYTSCSSCIAASGCGWCDSSDTCMPGTFSGPSTGSCAWLDWDWVDCAAPADPCASHGDCASCAADGTNGCGWCETTSTCRQGTASGPSSGTCSSWDWTVSDCDGVASCASYTTCESCLAADGCGWCDASDTCMPGDFGGPSAGTCAWLDWDWADCA